MVESERYIRRFRVSLITKIWLCWCNILLNNKKNVAYSFHQSIGFLPKTVRNHNRSCDGGASAGTCVIPSRARSLFAPPSSSSSSTVSQPPRVLQSSASTDDKTNNNDDDNIDSKLSDVLDRDDASSQSNTNADGLPIFDVLEDVTKCLSSKANLLLEAPPGAGKTTVLPLAILAHHRRCRSRVSNDNKKKKMTVWIIEPRRLATKAAASRTSALLGTAVGSTIGYAVRGDVRTSPSTEIVFVTEGVLLRRLRSDPNLGGIGTVVFDEFHERGLASDLGLVLCREVQKRRLPEEPLKIVVMSATLFGDPSQTDHNPGAEPSTAFKLIRALGATEHCGVITSEGRQYPVRALYANQLLSSDSNSKASSSRSPRRRFAVPPLSILMRDRRALAETTCDVVQQALILAPNNGDVLVFLPGAAEVRRVVSLLQERRLGAAAGGGVEVLPLYGALPRNQQDYVVFPPSTSSSSSSSSSSTEQQPKRRRRIIVATPIAEASLTIPHITAVVDSGLRRSIQYDPSPSSSNPLPTLRTVRCSRSSAIQRTGRAGRIPPGGVCIRVYDEVEFTDTFQERTEPEIECVDLAGLVLALVDDGYGGGGVREMRESLEWVDPPSVERLEKAVDVLVSLGALERGKEQDTDTDDGDDDGNNDEKYNEEIASIKGDRRCLSLTKTGRAVAEIPTDTRLAVALAHASDDPVKLAGATAVAFLLDDETASARGGTRGRGSANADLAPRVRDLFQNVHNNGERKTKKMATEEVALLKFAVRIGQSAELAVRSVLEGLVSPMDVVWSLGTALLPGYRDLIGQRLKKDAGYGASSYRLSLGRTARLDGGATPTSSSTLDEDAASSDYLVVVDTTTGDDGITRIRSYASVSKETLLREAKEQDEIYTVPSRGYEVRGRRTVKLGAIELSSTPIPTPVGSNDAVAALKDAMEDLGGLYQGLVTNSSAGGKKKGAARKDIDRLCGRVWLASRLEGAEMWPRCFGALDAQARGTATEEDRAVLEELLDPWLATIQSLKEVNVYEALLSSMTQDQQWRLDASYPPTIKAPDGSNIPVHYPYSPDDDDEDNGQITPPTASAKLQQFFGTLESPSVGPTNGRRIALSLSLLSPSGKVLAQTVDLPFFWKEVYPSVRAEMRGRYGKHPWPENPMTANATRETKQRQATLAAANGSEGSNFDRRKLKNMNKKKKRGKKK